MSGLPGACGRSESPSAGDVAADISRQLAAGGKARKKRRGSTRLPSVVDTGTKQHGAQVWSSGESVAFALSPGKLKCQSFSAALRVLKLMPMEPFSTNGFRVRAGSQEGHFRLVLPGNFPFAVEVLKELFAVEQITQDDSSRRKCFYERRRHEGAQAEGKLMDASTAANSALLYARTENPTVRSLIDIALAQHEARTKVCQRERVYRSSCSQKPLPQSAIM